jgi:hypothetical protein
LLKITGSKIENNGCLIGMSTNDVNSKICFLALFVMPCAWFPESEVTRKSAENGKAFLKFN